MKLKLSGKRRLWVKYALCALCLPAPGFAEEEIHFSDNFESATLGSTPPNSSTWTIAGAGGWYTANATTANTQNHTTAGSQAMYSSGGNAGQGIGDWNAPGFGGVGAITNGRAEIWFYDDMAATKRQWAAADDNTGNQWLAVIVRSPASSSTKYCYQGNAVAQTVSTIDRTLGWHKVEWIRDNTLTSMYLDGVLLATETVAQFANFNDFDCGSFSWDALNGNTGMWFDDAKVVRGQNQSRYRWYQNNSAENPTAMAAENTAITNVGSGNILRLRVQAQNDMSYNWTGAYVALRYREGASGVWTDFGASRHWNYTDGMGSNGYQVANARLTNTNIREHFAEGSPSSGIVSVPSTQYAEWDFCITPVWANVTKGTPYSFKLVLVDGAGTYLSDLVAYPRLATATVIAPKTWNGAVNSDWSNANNWTPAAVPVTGDDVIIPDAATTPNDPDLDMNATGANSIRSLTVNTAGILNLLRNASLQIDENAFFYGSVNRTQVVVNISGSTVVIGGAFSHGGSGDIVANNATMTVNPGANYTMSGNGGNVMVKNLVVNGLFAQTTANNTLSATNITINSGGEFRNTRVSMTSLVNISGTFTNNGTMSASTGGNFRFSGAASVIGGSSTTTNFYAFTLLSGQTTVSATASPAFTVRAGGVTLTSGVLSAANKTIAVAAGSWTNNGGTLTGSGSTVKFTLGSGVNIDLGTTQTTFQNVEVAKTAGQNLTAGRALNIDGNFAITTGNFVPGAFTHNVAGNWSDAGGSFAPAGGTIILDGSSPAITTLAANNFFNLTVSTSGTASMGASELDVNGALVVSAGATLDCGSSALNDVAGTTTVPGTLNMGIGTTNLRGAVTVNNTGRMVLQTSGGTAPTVRLGNGGTAGSITLAGTLQAAGSPRPLITRQGTANHAFTVQNGATVNIDGLTIDRPNASGLSIANGATITKIDNCYFTNGPGAGATYLAVGAAGGSYTFSYCDFDANAAVNVAAPGGAIIVMNNASGARGGEPNGEAFDGAVDANITWTYSKRWNGSASALWNNANNWTPAGIPVSTDNVVIPSGMPNQPQLNMNATGANSISSLTLVGGAALNLNGGAFTLRVDGNAAFNGTVTQTTGIVDIGGTTVTIGGPYTQSDAGTFTAGSATMAVSSGASYTQSGTGAVSLGNLSVSGTYSQTTNNNTLSLTNLTINSGGTFTNTVLNTNSQVNISGNFTNNGSMSSTTGGNFRFSGGAGVIDGISTSTNFWQFTLLSGTTTISTSANPAFTVLGGSVTLTSGTLSAAGKTIAVQGAWTNNGGSLSGSGSTIKFTGGTAATIDNGTAQTVLQNVEVAKSAGINLTASRALNIDGNFTITTGNFVPGAFTHNVAGNWNDAGGGFAPAAGTVILDGASPTVATAAINNFWNLTVSASGTISMGTYELDVNGALTVSSGSTLNCGSGTANDVAGATDISGTLDMGTATTNLRGAVSVNSGGTFRLLTATSAPLLRLGTGAVAGSITVASGGTLTATGSPRPTITCTGTANYSLTVSSGATISIDGCNIDYPGTNGLNIANGATVSRIDNCYFTNGLAGSTTYLKFGITSGAYTFSFCSFDANCQYNVSAPAGSAANLITMLEAIGAKGADPTGEANDNDPDGDIHIIWNYGKLWTGTTSTDWSVGTNWTPSGTPGSTDNVVITDQTNDPVVPVAGGTAKRILITNGVLDMGANTLQVYGDFIVQPMGTFNAGTGRVTLTGSGNQQINATGKTFYNLTITNNRADTLNSSVTVGNALLVDAGSSLTVASGKTLNLTAGLNLNGTLELKDNVILFTGGNISAASGSAFKVSGTTLLSEGYTTIQNNGSGNFTMTLAGNVEINCARFYNLGNSGVSLSGSGGAGRTFTNNLFYSGQSSSICYLHVLNSGWNGYNFFGLGFQDMGSGTRSVEINTTPTDQIYMNGYNTGTGWVSGDASEIETSGIINWSTSTVVPVWTRNSLGTIKGGSLGDLFFVGTDKTTQELACLDPADNGATKWTFDASAYGTCGMPTYGYSGGSYKIVSSAGNYIIGRQDEPSPPSSQLFPPQPLASPGNPYISPDEATFYVVYSGNITRKSLATGADISGWPQPLANVSRTADPVVFNDEVYVATTGGRVYKYDADGTPGPYFNAGASVNQPLLYMNSMLYITPNSANLYAVNPSADITTAVWSVSLAAANTGPAFCNILEGSKKIYVAAGANIQRITDNGGSCTLDWTYGAGATVESGPIEYNSVVFFGRNDGRYYAIRDRETSATLIFNWPYTNTSGNSNTGPWIDEGNSIVIFGTTGQDLDAFTLE